MFFFVGMLGVTVINTNNHRYTDKKQNKTTKQSKTQTTTTTATIATTTTTQDKSMNMMNAYIMRYKDQE